MDFELSSVLIVLLGVGLALITLCIVHSRSLFLSIILLSVSSLLITLCYLLMDAPDVAMTEAAIGVCLSAAVWLRFAYTVPDSSDGSKNQRVAIVFCIILAAIMIYAGLDLTPYGNGVTSNINEYFLSHTKDEIGIPSFVAAILASYRGYDTLGETTVIFTAALAVFMILRCGRSASNETLDLSPDDKASSQNDNLILRVITKFISLFVILLAIYIQLNGETSPGGGFQAGAIFASIIIGMSLALPSFVAQKKALLKNSPIVTAGGLFTYAMTGFVPMLLGSKYLDYTAFAASPQLAEQIGIFMIELGVGLTVGGGMLLIYFMFDVECGDKK